MDSSDYRIFIEPIRHRMVGSIWRIVRDPDDTEDVLQNVLLKVAKQGAYLRNHPSPTGLVLRICVNAAIDWRRQKTTQSAAVEDGYPLECLHTPGPSHTDKLVWRERQTRVLTAMEELPRREAEAILLLVMEGFSCSEAAEAMGCSSSTVRALAHKARKRLRQVWSEEDASHLPQATKEA